MKIIFSKQVDMEMRLQGRAILARCLHRYRQNRRGMGNNGSPCYKETLDTQAIDSSLMLTSGGHHV
ncbi:MAG: hypothetical protein UMU75_11885 [Halomonas sp.]|nr:hypothetical protein [Halomonas sp.]